MGENSYEPFKDKKMSSTWVRRGIRTNKKSCTWMRMHPHLKLKQMQKYMKAFT